MHSIFFIPFDMNSSSFSTLMVDISKCVSINVAILKIHLEKFMEMGVQ